MDTIKMNTKFLEWDTIALAKAAGELKSIIRECQIKLDKRAKNRKTEEQWEELLFMWEELWQYIQNLEVIQRMYEETEEELVSIVTSLNFPLQ